MAPDVFQVLVQSEQSKIPVTCTQMIDAMDFVPRHCVYGPENCISKVLLHQFSNWWFHNWATSWENWFSLYANNRGADQPAHPHSLISDFAVCFLDSIIPVFAKFKVSRLASLCSWAGWFLSYLVQSPKDGYSRDMAQLYFRPMIQKKLDVLGKAGLTKDDFSAADTTRVKVRYFYIMSLAQHILQKDTSSAKSEIILCIGSLIRFFAVGGWVGRWCWAASSAAASYCFGI